MSAVYAEVEVAGRTYRVTRGIAGPFVEARIVPRFRASQSYPPATPYFRAVPVHGRTGRRVLAAAGIAP